MKRIIIISALMLLLLGGCAKEQKQMEYIGADSAKKLALEAAGVSAGDAEFTSTDMNTRNGMDYYEVQFTCNGNSYCYDVEAMTGVIIDSQTPAAAQSGTSVTAPPEDSLVTDADTYLPSSSIPAEDAASSAENPAPATENPVPAAAGAPQSGSQGTVTVEEAKAAALAHAGLTASQVTFVKNKLDWDDGRQVYEIEFYTSDYTKYDYDIDASTGQVLKYDYEAEYYNLPDSPESGPISSAQAKQLALAQVPGAAEADIREFETDYDDGRLEYEGKIIYNEMEYEFEIDGYSGAIRKWEAESIYD